MHIRAYFARITDRTLHSIMRSRPSENLIARGENCSDGKSLLLDIILDYAGGLKDLQMNTMITKWEIRKILEDPPPQPT